MRMGTIPRGIYSYQELRKRWMISILFLGGVSAVVAFFLDCIMVNCDVVLSAWTNDFLC